MILSTQTPVGIRSTVMFMVDQGRFFFFFKMVEIQNDRSLASLFPQEAKQCLDEHTRKIKEENGVLRKELLQLIKRTRALHEHRRELEEQHKRLLRELQYSRDLKKLRGSRQNRLHKNFGINDEMEENKQT